MRRTLFSLALVVLLATSFPTVAEPSRDADAGLPGNARQGAVDAGVPVGGPRAPAVVNRVLDLLQVAVLFDTDSADPVWESEIFDTSRFTRIGLKVSGTVDRSGLVCGVHWRFSRDDEFLGPRPLTAIQAAPVGGERPDGIPDLSIGTPSTYSEIYGLQAKVVCAPLVLLGDDPSIGESGAAGELTDVKVLLRRE